MKETFQDINFRKSSLDIIDKANDIIVSYQRRGFKLTLRQLYYQFVSRALIENKQSEYKRLGKIVNDGRLAGLIDWSAIEDRTRNLKKPSAWSSPSSIINAVAAQYQENLWATQPNYVEVWIEKDALIGVIEPICETRRLPFFACRGYASQSELYDAGQRLARKVPQQNVVILHLGDHDPSGLDMTRDVSDRLNKFAQGPVEIRRLALNMAQVEQYDPPPNPAKDTDARFEGYRDLYGDESWELDALDPDVISDLIDDEVEQLVDQDLWDDAVAAEEANKSSLQEVSSRWEDVMDFIAGKDT